jgi:Arc/MetJ-type ribon-helix-helix transcriptional regulator
LQTYANVIDEYGRDAIRRLEAFRHASTARQQEVPKELTELKQFSNLQQIQISAVQNAGSVGRAFIKP